ncbi:MAG: ABC transporter ATP-binding protein [Candidatus Caldarchaeales archaeon]|jgi:peptide/nickel transport system ATP-binding protein|nr:ABC transporter ATP-binding protein [Candidatus Caldarchaeales archaeon]MDT7915055.1 ABC transporter ATP-binding protein [Candidatus Caldarchaeales archaeon]
MSATGILRVEELRVYYSTPKGYVRAVDDVSFSLHRGESLAVVGESGSGKTTLGLTLMRALPRNANIVSGRIFLNDEDTLSLSAEEFRKKYSWSVISMVFQGAMNSLNPVLKVGEQVAEPLIYKGGLTREEAKKVAEEFIELVGMPREFYNRYPHELSGGMRQRIVIAMALVMKPQILILDEPTSALDVTIQAQIINLVKDLIDSLKLSVVFITHDVALASDVSDRIAVMYGGQIVELGLLEQVLGDYPIHPYTEKLLASLPRLRGDNVPEFIPGRPPDLASPPPGCRFHPRCPYAFDKCRVEDPPLFRQDSGHLVKCWLRG